MARLARVVAPGLPHHVTQRGNRGQQTFFGEDDYREYLSLLAQWSGEFGVRIWAYCLMPNHVHLILVPSPEDALCRAVGEAHRRYTRHVNFRQGWRGHLWQPRRGPFGRPVRAVRPGRAVPPGRRPLRRTQPGQGQAGQAGRGLALEQRRGPRRRAGGRPGRGRLAERTDRRVGLLVVGVSAQARRPGPGQGHAAMREHRPATGRGAVPG